MTGPTDELDEEEGQPERTEADEIRGHRSDYMQAMRKCSPRERQLIKALPEHDFRRWAAGAAIGMSKAGLHKLLGRAHVRAAIKAFEELDALQLGISKRMLLQEYERLARSRLSDFFGPDGTMLEPKEWTPDMAAVVQERSYDKNGNLCIKLHDKGPALAALSKYLKLMPDGRFEVTGKNGEKLNPGLPPVIQIVRYADAKAEGDARADSPRAD